MTRRVPSPAWTRRQFVRNLAGLGALSLSGLDLLGQAPSSKPQAFRFAFLTDLHLLKDGALRSAEGIAACLSAMEKIEPRPDFILVGGDLVNNARGLLVPEAERQLDLFLRIWNDHTALPAHWVFGNHDLVGTSNSQAVATDPHYGKGLFHDRLGLKDLSYTFDWKGWHFVILDDVEALPNRSYIGRVPENELSFLRTQIDVPAGPPTIVSTHIPFSSLMALGMLFAQAAGRDVNPDRVITCSNADAVMKILPGHQVKAVLCGHIHHYEQTSVNGVRYINSGAVCGNYWRGPMLDCKEGFGVVDVGPDGSVAFDYRDYGWTA